MIGTLIRNGLLNVKWGDDELCYVHITDAGRTYFERERMYQSQNKEVNGTSVNIYSTGGNVIFGNVIDSTLNINYEKIEKQIDINGGNDKEELRELLLEAKEIIENIQKTKVVQTRKRFVEKISKHLTTHGWFYGAITELIAGEIFKILAGN